MGPQPAELDPHFTVFIRLPFPRGDFVDPPPVEWGVAKDHALWDILSRPSKGNDIDWKALAEHFDVTLPFLLQQAAWLYDRQLSQVRAQVRKVGNPHSSFNSPAPPSISGSGAIGGHPMKRGGSSNSRVPSRLSMRQKEGQAAKQEPSVPSTPIKSKAPLHPNPSSANPPAQAAGVRPQSPPRPASYAADAINRDQPSDKKENRAVTSPLTSPPLEQESSEPASSSSSSSSDSEEEEPTRRGPPFKRFGEFSIHKGPDSLDEDEDDSPAFLPLDAHRRSSTEQMGHDPSATLRQEPEQARAAENIVPLNKISATESSASSASSGLAGGHAANERTRPVRHPTTFSPRRTAELARLSPRRRGREGSEGTPSMGSSFSDLDDASLTQSALEEALLSTMQRGGVASRMSTISQALRSRYL